MSIIVKSDLLLRNNEHNKYPNLFNTKFLFWVKLMASMWQNEAECPNISMYIAIIKYSFIFLALSPFSFILGFNVLNSFNIILSSSCFDFVYPILLISYCSSFDRVDDEVISDYLYYFNIYKIKNQFLNPICQANVGKDVFLGPLEKVHKIP